MDAKDQELYAEEQRKALLAIQKGIEDLLDKYEAPVEAVTASIDNDVLDVNIGDKTLSVSLENEIDLRSKLDDIAENIAQAVADSAVDEVKVSNFPKTKDQKSIAVSNFKGIESLLGRLLDKEFDVTIKQEAPKFPTTAKSAIPVRLSDGKSFYNAIMSAVASGGSGVKECAPRVAEDSGDPNKTYIGTTDPDQANNTSKAVWKIKRLDVTSGLITLYAEGNAKAVHVWDNREALNY